MGWQLNSKTRPYYVLYKCAPCAIIQYVIFCTHIDRLAFFFRSPAIAITHSHSRLINNAAKWNAFFCCWCCCCSVSFCNSYHKAYFLFDFELYITQCDTKFHLGIAYMVSVVLQIGIHAGYKYYATKCFDMNYIAAIVLTKISLCHPLLGGWLLFTTIILLDCCCC